MSRAFAPTIVATPAALGLFDGALAEDSLFALAAYYAALSEPAPKLFVRRARADRSARASDRERLVILAGWAHATSSPSLRAIADTLAERYPTEVEGHSYAGMARVHAVISSRGSAVATRRCVGFARPPRRRHDASAAMLSSDRECIRDGGLAAAASARPAGSYGCGQDQRSPSTVSPLCSCSRGGFARLTPCFSRSLHRTARTPRCSSFAPPISFAPGTTRLPTRCCANRFAMANRRTRRMR